MFKSFVISSGTRLSPEIRKVANVRSNFIEDIPDGLAVDIRHHTVIVYYNAVGGSYVATCLNLVNRFPKLPTLNSEAIADVICWISYFIPDDTRHFCQSPGPQSKQVSLKIER